MVDFSGAVAEAIDLSKEQFYNDENRQDAFFEDLLKVWDRGGIISSSIRVSHYLLLQVFHVYVSLKTSAILK